MLLTLGICATIKLAAMAEWAPLFRIFLFLPATAISIFTGTDYTESAGVYRFDGFVLDYSCAGINFFILSALTLALLKRPSILAAYLTTIVANIFRIALSLKLLQFSPSHPWLHEITGMAVFLFFLLLPPLLIREWGPKAGVKSA